METRRVSEVELDSAQSSLTRRVSNLVTASLCEPGFRGSSVSLAYAAGCEAS